jgi:hypothetical protein
MNINEELSQIINIYSENSYIYIYYNFDGCDSYGPKSWVIELIKKDNNKLEKYDLYLDIDNILSGFENKNNLSFTDNKKIYNYLKKFNKLSLNDFVEQFNINKIEH